MSDFLTRQGNRPEIVRLIGRADLKIRRIGRWFAPESVAKLESLERELGLGARSASVVRRGRVRILRKATARDVNGYAIGQAIREARLRRGLTQDELARRSSIARPNLARVEGGRHVPSLATLRKIAGALGVRVSAFVEREGRGRGAEEAAWAESGLGEWGQALEREDRSR